MEKEEKYLGRLLKEILSNESEIIQIPIEIDKEKVLEIAKGSGVLSLVYPYLCDGNVSFNSREFRIHAANLAKSIRQDGAFEELIKDTEKENIDILMLKGIWIKSLYPTPENRSMNDVDLFYYWNQKKPLFRALKRLNYRLIDDNFHHSVWLNDKINVSFEMHHTLEKLSFYDNPFFNELLSRTEKCESKNHLYHMTLNDAYSYQMVHIYENVLEGTGSLKQLCDLYVLRQNGVVFEDLKDSFKTLKIEEFANQVYNLILYFFDGEKISLSEDEKRILDIYLHTNKKSRAERVVEARIRNEGSKSKYIIKMFFPKKEKMYINYPNLRKHKYLLPFFYIRRIIVKIFVHDSGVAREVKKQKSKL